MKKNGLFCLCVAILAISCHRDEDDGYADYLVARPLTIGKSEFRQELTVTAPRPVEASGKIYAYGDYVFVNDAYRGVHVVDNSDPSAPKKMAFIPIYGNMDISVKDDMLYADSMTDLVVLDISDIDGIHEVARLVDVLQGQVAWPQADIYEDGGVDYEHEMVVGWETTTERRAVADFEPQWERENGGVVFDAFSSGSETGQGGSMARFKIVGDHLYAVDSHTINIFDITDLDAPEELEDVNAGFDIETIFNQGPYLFLGSMRGMYIYDIADPAHPSFVSEFEHGTACDPVVVDGDYAYVTLRGGNFCGATESGLFIVDISDITAPELREEYPMDGPYGLGINGDMLFVCDGDSGLKVFDKTDISHLESLGHFKDLVAYDVIPLPESLLLVGDGVLRQYAYGQGAITLLSTLELGRNLK